MRTFQPNNMEDKKKDKQDDKFAWSNEQIEHAEKPKKEKRPKKRNHENDWLNLGNEPLLNL